MAWRGERSISKRNGSRDAVYTADRLFYLTPPGVLTFAVSLVLALIGRCDLRHLMLARGVNGFLIRLIAYLVLLAVALFRGL